MNTFRFSSLLIAAGLATGAFAQIDPSNDTRPALQGDPAGLVQSTAAEDGGDYSKLVVARYVVDYRAFVLNDFEFQTNADLSGDAGEHSFVWLPTVGATANVKFNSPFSIEATAALQAAFYADVSNLDFWGVDAVANLNYEISPSWTVYAGPEVYNYQSLDGGGELSSGVAPTAGVRHTHVINSRTTLFAGARYQHHFVSPSSSERDVWSGDVGFVRQFTSTCFGRGFYEYRYSDYLNAGGRQDWRNTVGVSGIYVPSKGLRISTGVTFSTNDSTESAAEFRALNIGIGSALTWDF
ncbi:MAG TPA: hypothetical protein VIM44_05235 [Rariglobus sp.]